MNYDLIVLGGGPGGYTGAIRAAKLGMKVALIEERDLGGTCLNRGCIPTKTLLHSSELYRSRQHFESLGILADNIRLDEQKLFQRKDAIVKQLRSGVESLVKANQIDLYPVRGSIAGEKTVTAGTETLHTEHILIATGSRPAGFDPARPIPGIEFSLNSDDVLTQPVEGNEIVIIGAGVIGVEFADYFCGIGKNVTLLAPGDRIVRFLSTDMSTQLSSVFKRNGIKIITSAKVTEITKDKAVTVQTDKGEVVIRADAVISAVGRSCNIENIGLENVGIKAQKSIRVDENMYTGVGSIYACGDVTGDIQLAHYAAAAAITAVESMLQQPHSLDMKTVPSCIYTMPEISAVGKNESQVAHAKVGKFLMAGNGKSMVEGIGRGFIKVIADEEDVIVGAELFCARATDILGELSLAVSKKMKLHQLTSVIHPHPTVMEAIGEALEDIEGMATHGMPKRR